MLGNEKLLLSPVIFKPLISLTMQTVDGASVSAERFIQGLYSCKSGNRVAVTLISLIKF